MRRVLIILILFISQIFLVGSIYGRKNKTYKEDNKTYNNDKGVNSKVIAADFTSLQGCVESIKKDTGSPLKIITDTPSQVSGFLSNGSHFGCVEKVSDEKGTYVDGWYTVK